MKTAPDPRTATKILKNCADQLRKAYDEMDHDTVPLAAMSKIDGTASALSALAEQFDEVLGQYQRTVGGLRAEVERLRQMNSALSSRAISEI